MACMGERRRACRVFIGTAEGKIPLGRPGVDLRIILKWKPISVAARCEAYVCGLSLSGIEGLNPAGSWTFVSCECCVLYV
jgi:hypothetical protein